MSYLLEFQTGAYLRAMADHFAAQRPLSPAPSRLRAGTCWRGDRGALGWLTALPWRNLMMPASASSFLVLGSGGVLPCMPIALA